MLSRREKLILIVTVAALSIFVLDRYVWTPLSQERDRLAAEKLRLSEELQNGTRMIRARRDLMPRWKHMASEAIADDPAAAETRLLHAVRGWSREAKLNLTSVQPERPPEKGELRQVVVSANGSGSMAAIAQFLYLLESSQEPVKVQRLRIASSERELTLELRISTLYRAPVEQPRSRPARSASAQSGDRGKERAS